MTKFYNKFYLIGAGGYGKQLSKMLKTNKIIKSSIFVDNKFKLNLKKFIKLKDKIYFSIFLGEPSLRESIFNYLKKKKNLTYSTLILSNSNLYTNRIGKGCIIEHYVLLSSDVSIGVGCLILTGSVIGHNSKIGNFCNIGTNVTISGNVKIGKKVIVGSQSFISNNITICSNVIISPGSVVLKNITKPGVYSGNIFIKS
jgi:sugar O-acyltransferase (sialic acid O-acetyltransferase NeuD family)